MALSRTPLLSIPQTCFFWRTIVLKNPHLWTSVDFSRILPETIELWAQWSGTLPLSITYNGDTLVRPNHKIPLARHSRIKFILVNNILRVRHLDLKADLALTTRRLFTLSAEVLETLCVRRSKLHPPVILPCIFFCTSPPIFLDSFRCLGRMVVKHLYQPQPVGSVVW